MKNIITKFLAIVAVLAVSAAFNACTEEYNPSKATANDGSLRFKISSVDNPETKSSSEDWLQPVDLSEDGFPLLVIPSVSVNTYFPVSRGLETKGAMVNKQSLLESCATSGIPVSMLTSNGTATDVKSGWLKPGGTEGEDYWSLYDENGDKIDWVESDDMSGAKASFLSYYDKAGSNVVKNVYYNTLTFTYEGIESSFTLGTSSADAATDAKNMDDFIVAYTGGIDHQTDHGTDEQVNYVNLHYYHPLAAVRFVAPVAADRDKSVSINRVSINNVKTGGSVTYNTSTDTTSTTAFKNAFTWSLGDARGNYAQKFSTNQNDMTFFIVPQSLTDVVVTFNIVHTGIDGTKHEHQLTAPASKLGTTSWDQGYIYTYTLDTKAIGKVDIDIQENFTAGGEVKKDVAVKNLVQSTAFVRAKAIANWCTDSGKIICSLPLIDSGTSKNITINTTDWLLGADGYYYCKLPVRGYSSSPVFIKEFKQPTDISGITNGAQINGLHIEMSIIAQGVESDSYSPSGTTYIEAAWTDANGKILLADGSSDLLAILKF